MSEETDSKYTCHFQEEVDMIKEEMEKVDNLYEDIMGRITNISDASKRKTSGNSPFTFISNMMENALSAKTSKINLIKELVHIKKYIADFDLKSIKSEGNDEEKFKALAAELMVMANKSFKGEDDNDIIEDIEDLDLEKMAEDAWEEEMEGEIDLPTNKCNKNEPIGDLVADQEGDVFYIDEDGEYLGVPDNLDIFEAYEDESGEIVKVINTETNEELELVES